jgi:hypothetical protein
MRPAGASLSAAEARRALLAAQGFAERRPTGRVDRRHLRRVFDRVGLVQIDSVNVLVRSQELPLFARLGAHPRTLLPDATSSGELFEYWGHEASHIPVDQHHLFRWKMERAAAGDAWKGVVRIQREHPGFVEGIYEQVRELGPVAAGDLRTRTRPKGTWWDWDDAKIALEYLFWTGRLTATRRASDFARLYDVPERVIPAPVLARPTPPEREARAELLLLAARSLGVATLADLADYHRQKAAPAREALDDLVEAGRLLPVTVQGWDRPAYLHPEARVPRRVTARALLSPFDSLVWDRARTERVFGFRYRIEIYVPRPQRQYGYYVLPFLLGDRLVARVDMKADRAAGVLRVHAAHAEPAVAAPPPAREVAAELAEELREMAAWLGLERVQVDDRGDLARHLADAITTVGP